MPRWTIARLAAGVAGVAPVADERDHDSRGSRCGFRRAL